MGEVAANDERAQQECIRGSALSRHVTDDTASGCEWQERSASMQDGRQTADADVGSSWHAANLEGDR